jgi:isopentenyl-diphosphate delta-isomerase type 1
MPLITFVDENDNVIGAGTKLEAREKGIRFRIVRVFLFNSQGHLLMQRRAMHLKSHPGRWDQSVGGHVDEGETYLQAAVREAEEEIGVTGLILREEFKHFANDLDGAEVKRRFNMLYSAVYDGDVTPNPEEVAEVKWVAPDELEQWLNASPDDFSPGFIRTYNAFRQSR